MLKKKIITGIIAIIMVVGIIIGFLMNSTEETSGIQNLKVSEVTRSVFYAPQYVAINKGFFEKNQRKNRLNQRKI